MSLQEINVGDEVFLMNAYERVWHLVRINRATPTQLGYEGSTERFMRSSGWRVGDGSTYHPARMQAATPETRKQVAEQQAWYALESRISNARHALRAVSLGEDNIARVEAFLASLKNTPPDRG